MKTRTFSTPSVFLNSVCVNLNWIHGAIMLMSLAVTTPASGQIWSTLPGGLNSSVAFSPDGMRLASASYDGFVRLWDAATGTEIRQFVGHTDGVTSVAFSPDGMRLASASYDGTVRLWDAATGTEIRQFGGHTRWVTSVAFSPDGMRLASASYDGTVRLWDAAAGTEIRQFVGHTDYVNSVAFSPDGMRLASASDDRTVRLWDAAAGTEIRQFGERTGSVSSVAFSPDGESLVSATNPKSNTIGGSSTIHLWDVATGTESRQFVGHSGSVSSVAFSPDGMRLAASLLYFYDPFIGSQGGTVHLWDAATGTESRQFVGHSGSVSSVAFSPDGMRLASASDDGTVHLWDAATGTVIRQLGGHSGSVSSVAFSPDGMRLASASSDRTVRLWDAATGTVIRQFGHTGSVRSVAFSPDGMRLASASNYAFVSGGRGFNTVSLWDTATGTVIREFGHTDRVYSVAFSPDGMRLASASNYIGQFVSDHTVHLWDVTTGTEIHRFVGHTSYVNSVAFSPDGMRLASASYDGTVRLWDAATGTEIRQFVGHTDYVNSVAFSPDGMRLASASYDGTVRLWDVASGNEIGQFGHTDRVRSVAFSPDGMRLASASVDHTVRLWDAATGTEIRRFVGHTGSVSSVAFSPDGMHLASGSSDRTIKLWALPVGFSSEVPDQTFMQGQSITPLVLPEATGAASPIRYGLTPALPAGLSFNAGTRTISGTPTAVTPARTYTYTATDANGASASQTFTIKVVAGLQFTQTVANQTFMQGQSIPPLVLPEATGGASPIRYGLTPALPAGLSFNAGTRTISGTPAAVTPAATYTYTATDANNVSASQTFTIEVVAGGGRFVDVQYDQGEAVGASGGDHLFIGLPPDVQMATRFVIDASTVGKRRNRTIVGNDREVRIETILLDHRQVQIASSAGGDRQRGIAGSTGADRTARMTASSVNGREVRIDRIWLAPYYANQFSNTTLPTTAPRDLTVYIYSDRNGVPGDVLFRKEIEDPRAHAGVTNFTLDFFELDLSNEGIGALPDIIHIAYGNAGTDDNLLVVGPAPYTAENLSHVFFQGTWRRLWDLTTTGGGSFNETVVPIRARFMVQSALQFAQTVADQSFIRGQSITPLVLPEATGGASPITYSLTPLLPAGLSFNPSTRTISGTPTAITPARTYTYTATDANGASASQTFTIEVVAGLQFTQTVADQSFMRGQSITPLVLPEATGGASPIRYSLTPALPAGLSFNDATRTISGTPTVVTPARTYTYTATDANGVSASQTFTIEVIAGLQFTQTVANQTFMRGQSVTSLVLPEATGGASPIRYSLTPALPTGLSFNTSTRTISGTPTAVTPARTYTYTATDANNASASQTFTIEVVAGGGRFVDVQYDQGEAVGAGGGDHLFIGLPRDVQMATRFVIDVSTVGKQRNRTIVGNDRKVRIETILLDHHQVQIASSAGGDRQREIAGSSGADRTERMNASSVTGREVRIDRIWLAPYYDNQFSNTTLPTDAPRDLTVYIYSDRNGVPGDVLFRKEIKDPRAYAGVTNFTLDFFELDLSNEGIGALPDIIHIAYGNAGTDDNLLVVGPAPYTVENLSHVYFQGTWRRLWDLTTTGGGSFNGTVVPIRARFRVQSALQFAQTVADQTFIRGQSITPLVLPEATGGASPITYRLSPALPAGLSFNAATRTISGTPTAVTPARAYTYTATDANGASASQQFTIEVHSPRIVLPGNIANQVFARARPITPLVLPEAIGGVPPIAYSLAPALPVGLSFNHATRTIRGTPTVVTPARAYTYTATDANGVSASQTFTIEVYSPVHAEQASLPESFTVRGNYPNPFQHATRLVFDLPWPARVSVEVMDLTGRRVAATPVSELSAGWGRSIELSTPSATSSGVYVYRVQIASPAGDAVHTGRFVRIR